MSGQGDFFADDEPIDAERWLYLQKDAVIGATTAAPVQLIEQGGLVAEVGEYQGAPDPVDVADRGRVRLFIDGNGKVRWAESG